MNSWLISGIILVVGFFICLILILRSKWKITDKNLNDYEEGRNKLTFRKKKVKKVEVKEEGSWGFSLANLIGAFVVLLIGFSLIGPIMEQMEIATDCSTANVTTPFCESGEAVGTEIMELIPIFFALAIVIAALGAVFGGLRSSGLV